MSTKRGKLKLKGGYEIKSGKIQKRKRKKKNQQPLTDQTSINNITNETQIVPIEEDVNGIKLLAKDNEVDRRTLAEKIYDAKMMERNKERAMKLAEKSHRERVKEFNERLASLTEHHDIPKVGPG